MYRHFRLPGVEALNVAAVELAAAVEQQAQAVEAADSVVTEAAVAEEQQQLSRFLDRLTDIPC